MRKVLSFVLVLSLVLGSFGMAFAAPLSDMAGEASSEAVNVLTELGVVKGYPDGTYKPDKIVTRAEMAVIVVSALGLADYAVGTSSFKDMGGHWSNSFVAYATSLGVIAGYPDGTFKPDKTVSYDEAATMLVAALGYTPDSLTGTWPANYVIKAKTLGILDGIKAGTTGANRGDIAIMAFQTLAKEIGKVNKDGEWKANGTEEDPDTMLARLGADLYDGGKAFVVEGDEDTVINLKPYLGANVVAYQNSDKEIIAIKEVKSVYLTGEIDGSDFKADGVKYNFDTTTESAIKFVNGEKDGVVTDVEYFINNSSIDEFTLAVKLSGKKMKEIHSVASWVADDAFLFEKDMLDDEELEGHKFAQDDNDEIDFSSFELAGVNSLSDIKEDNVVYVYEKGGNGDIAKITVGTEIVTGKVTKITSNNKKITVNGKVYEFSNAVEAVENADGVKINDEYELYLDFEGKIFAMEGIDVTKADKYAVILKTEKKGEGAITAAKAKVELFLADGTSKVFDVSGKIDSAKSKGLINDGVWVSGAAIAGTIVKYGVDKDGIVSSLEKLQTVSKNGEELTEKGYYATNAVASDSVIFTTNDAGDSDDADDWGVTTLSKAKGSKYNADYFYDVDSKRIEAMILKGAGSGDDDVYAIIAGGWAQDASSSTDYVVELYADGGRKAEVYPVIETVYDARDSYGEDVLYKLKLNSKGEIEEFDAHGLSEVAGVITNDGAFSKNNIEVKVGSDTDDYSIDSDATVYIMVEGEIDKAEKPSRNNLKASTNVKLYKTDDDGGYNIIIVE